MAKKAYPPRPGQRPIFRPWITHPVTGKRVYPKNGRVFVIWIDDEAANDGK